jgi:hypothetical protein
MKFRRGIVFWVLALAGLACNLSEFGLGAPTATPTPEPAAAATPEPTEDPGPSSLDLEDSDLYLLPSSIIASYRTSFSYQLEGENEDGDFVQGAIVGSGVHVTDPAASSFELLSENTDILSELLPIKYAQVGEITALFEPVAGCSTFAAGSVEIPLADLVDLSQLLIGEAARIAPDENVNGLDVYVFQLTSENINPEALGLQALHDGRLYAAKTGGFVVKLTLDGTGSSELLTGEPEFVGQLNYEVSHHDFGQPLEIAPPVECIQVDSIQEGLELPRLFDAFGELTYPGFTIYRTGFKYQESVLFYRGEMINQGWNLLDELDDGQFALLTFSNDLFAVQIAIQEDPETGEVVIAIIQIES